MNWAIKGYSQPEIGFQVNNGARLVDLGSESVDEDAVETKGNISKNVDI